MLSVLGVSWSSIFFLHSLDRNTTENDGVSAPPPSSSAVVLRDQDGTVATLKDSAAGAPFFLCTTYQAKSSSHNLKGEFLQSRTFRGLETRAGLDPPNVLQQGRNGIARGYDDDYRA